MLGLVASGCYGRRNIQARQGQVGLGDALATGLVKEVNGFSRSRSKPRAARLSSTPGCRWRAVVLSHGGLEHVFELGDLLVAQLALQAMSHRP